MSHGVLALRNEKFIGEVRTYSMALDFQLEPIENRRSEKSPSYKIVARSPKGHYFDAGVCWEMEIGRGNSAGQKMFTLTFDDPAFGDKPINFTAFPYGLDTWDMNLSRAKPETNNAADEVRAVA